MIFAVVNCVADFIPLWHDCRDLNLVIAVTIEQSDRVSSLLYHQIHLFSLHPDLPVTDLLPWKGATLTLPIEIRLGDTRTGTKGPTRIRPHSRLALGDCYHYNPTRVSVHQFPTAARSRPYSHSTYVLIPGQHGPSNQPLCSPHGVSHHLLRKPRPSECHLGISDGTPLCCLR